MKETVEHNNRFYGEELKTESEQLKEWLVVANKHNEELQKERDMYKGSFEEMSKNYFESQNEIERLNNIIEEVREYIEKNTYENEAIKVKGTKFYREKDIEIFQKLSRGIFK